jgi:hypothetical protein
MLVFMTIFIGTAGAGTAFCAGVAFATSVAGLDSFAEHPAVIKTTAIASVRTEAILFMVISGYQTFHINIKTKGHAPVPIMLISRILFRCAFPANDIYLMIAAHCSARLFRDTIRLEETTNVR